MIKRFKLVLMVVVVRAVVATAQAGVTPYPAGDLLIGFTDGQHFDVVYDLGKASALTDGETWKFGSSGLNLTTNYNLSTVQWGVIGDNRPSGFVWTTTGGSTPGSVYSLVFGLDTVMRTIYETMNSPGGVGEYETFTPTDPDGWNQETINGIGPNQYIDVYENPNVIGEVSASFYYLTDSEQTGNGDTTPALLGTFTLASTGVVTYNTNTVVSTPAPVASFSGSPTNLFVSQSVVFTNTSANTFTNSIWSFGDGNMATNTTGANVTNKYNVAGTFTVSLTVSGTGGANMATSNNYVVVKPVPAIGNPMLLFGTNFVFSGTNGVAGAQYRIVSTNNLTVPLSNWPTVFTGTFKPDGSYNYTNSPATNSARFFRLVSP